MGPHGGVTVTRGPRTRVAWESLHVGHDRACLVLSAPLGAWFRGSLPAFHTVSAGSQVIGPSTTLGHDGKYRGRILLVFSVAVSRRGVAKSPSSERRGRVVSGGAGSRFVRE